MSTNNHDANDFYNRIVEGTDYTKTIDLQHSSGAKLEGVTMSPVNKQRLAETIEKLPEAMFDAVEDAEDMDNPEEALDESDEISMNAINGETIVAFEELIADSLTHEQLTRHQMEKIIENLDFEMLFELGSEVIDMSFERNGDVKDFHVRG